MRTASILLCLATARIQASDVKRQYPAEPRNVKVITSPGGASIRYKQPGDEGVCETTPGVKSYSGYISLNATTNMFFWFFEARQNASHAPLTLWLNGGPGSDSLIGLFQELGPCKITENITAQLNPYSWNEYTNLLFLSQPVGVGFSYETTGEGYFNSQNGRFYNESATNHTGVGPGRFSLVGYERTNTTMRAAIATWEILQAFLSELETLDNTVQNKTFNLWTESYGGHYGPTFYRYFYEQNLQIQNGSATGTELHMGTLGLINAVIDAKIQTPYYPKFARDNTYGIQAINDSIHDFMVLAYSIREGCGEWIGYCEESLAMSPDGGDTCSIAEEICRGLVEGPWYHYSGRGTYDIRHPHADPTPEEYWQKWLNTSVVQDAIGVNVNYTTRSSSRVGGAFGATGDYIFNTFKKDLEAILNYGVRVAMLYGDADYICNWFGGEALSLALNYTHTAKFRASGYAPFIVDGVEYGEGRQYGKLSFLRMYEAGHQGRVPYYQPKASLEFFRRVLGNLVVSDGSQALADDYSSPGPLESTHRNAYVPLPANATNCTVERC